MIQCPKNEVRLRVNVQMCAALYMTAVSSNGSAEGQFGRHEIPGTVVNN